MVHLPKYWGITIAAGLFNAGVWVAVAGLVLPIAWAVVVGGLTFAVTFWFFSLMQSLDRYEPSQPKRVVVRRITRDPIDILIH